MHFKCQESLEIIRKDMQPMQEKLNKENLKEEMKFAHPSMDSLEIEERIFKSITDEVLDTNAMFKVMQQKHPDYSKKLILEKFFNNLSISQLSDSSPECLDLINKQQEEDTYEIYFEGIDKKAEAVAELTQKSDNNANMIFKKKPLPVSIVDSVQQQTVQTSSETVELNQRRDKIINEIKPYIKFLQNNQQKEAVSNSNLITSSRNGDNNSKIKSTNRAENTGRTLTTSRSEMSRIEQFISHNEINLDISHSDKNSTRQRLSQKSSSTIKENKNTPRDSSSKQEFDTPGSILSIQMTPDQLKEIQIYVPEGQELINLLRPMTCNPDQSQTWKQNEAKINKICEKINLDINNQDSVNKVIQKYKSIYETKKAQADTINSNIHKRKSPSTETAVLRNITNIDIVGNHNTVGINNQVTKPDTTKAISDKNFAINELAQTELNLAKRYKELIRSSRAALESIDPKHHLDNFTDP